MRKYLVLFTVLLSITFLVIGCSTEEESSSNQDNTDDQIELTIAWWGTSVHHEKYLDVIELFEEKNPNVKIVPQYSGWNGYWEKLATQAAGSNLPDVIQMDYSRLNEYVSRDLIKDLGKYQDEGILNLEDVSELYIDSGSINDKLYAIALGTNSSVLAYDPAMFEEAGVEPLEPGYTWDEYVETARELKDKLGDETYVNIMDGLGDGFIHYLRQHGQWLYNDENTEIGFDKQMLVDYLNIFEPLREEGVVPTPEMVAAAAKGNEHRLIIDGESPTELITSSQVSFVRELTGRPIELTTLPDLPGGEKGHFIKPSLSFSVTTHATDETEKLAAEFIDFFTTSKEANDILLGIRGTPIFPEMQEYLYPKLDEGTQKVFDYITLLEEEYARELYPVPPAGQGEIDSLYDRLMEQYRYGNISAEELADQFVSDANEILVEASE